MCTWTGPVGRKVIQFIHFRHVTAPFGFLYFVLVEKDGIIVPKNKFTLQKNSLLNKLSQLNDNYWLENLTRQKSLITIKLLRTFSRKWLLFTILPRSNS